jgi:hypothetical protein
MPGVETNSPETAYLTKGNILVPKRAAGGMPVSSVGPIGEANMEDRLGEVRSSMSSRKIHGATDLSTIVVVEALKGTGAVNEIQVVVIPPATGGTFTLTFGANTTAPLAAAATGAVVQTALQGLASVGGANLTCIALQNGGPYVVTFTNALGLADQPAISGTGSLLVNASTPTPES